ncbi:Ribosomal protein L11 methyltransferase [Bienertia sinuspersici]
MLIFGCLDMRFFVLPREQRIKLLHLVDSFSEALLSFGANSVSMDEHDDYEESDEVNMCSIFTGHGDVTSCISCAADSIGIEMPTFELLEYDPYDWIKRTQESFDPVEVIKGLWIVPEWKTAPDAQATNIILNPGLAFGTGEHATTKMCLLLLHQCVKGGERFLDYGTGSGILSIAALKLGAALSVGVDIDPQAITAARQNAELNNIEPERLKLYLLPSKDDASFVEKVQEDLRAEELPADKNFVNTDKYDIVIANILLNPLLALADEIVSLAKVGATVGLSGILHDQVMHLS